MEGGWGGRRLNPLADLMDFGIIDFHDYYAANTEDSGDSCHIHREATGFEDLYTIFNPLTILACLRSLSTQYITLLYLDLQRNIIQA
jgi:hypothetical protein